MKVTRMLLLWVGLWYICMLSLPGWGEMSQHWRIDAGSVAWMGTTGDDVRGMCYNPVTDHVLVASCRGGNQIVVLDAGTGVALGTMNVSGVGGGVYAINKIRVVNLGGGAYSVYACNLVNDNKAASLILYRWNGVGGVSETTLAAPTVIYRNRASNAAVAEPSPVGPQMPDAGTQTFRMGIVMDAVHSGTTIQFYLPRSSAYQDTVYRFNYLDGAAEVSSIDPITLQVAGATGTTLHGATLDSFNGNIYYSTNVTNNFACYANDGGSKVWIPSGSQGNIAASCSHLRYGSIGGKNYLGYVDADPVGTGANSYRRIAVAEIPAGRPEMTTEVDFSPFLGVSGNTNNDTAGDVDFDTLRGRVLGLVTNNFVGSFSIDSASGIKKWDGGAGTSSWGDANNWDPDGVPGMNQDVVLDNSLLAGNYTVRIDTPAKTFGCRTLTVGDAVTANEIIFEITNDARIALHIVGTQDEAADFVVENGARFHNRSTAGSGNVLDNRNSGSTSLIKAGGYLLHDCLRTFTTPFAPPSTGNNGVITFESGSTMEFGPGSANSVALSNRTYANLRLTANTSKTYTGAGGLPLLILNELYIGPNVTFNPSMTGSFRICGNIISDGNGGTISTTSTGGVFFDGVSVIDGSGTPITLPRGFTVTPEGSLTLNHPMAIPAARDAIVQGALIVNSVLTVNGTLDLGTEDVTGTGSVVMAPGTALLTQHEDGLDGVQTTGVNNFVSEANYTFNGTAFQYTGAAFPTEVSNLTINNPAGVTLSGSITASVQLLLATGELSTAGHILTATDGTAAVVSTGGFVNGTLTRIVDVSIPGARKFDIGTTGSYAPVTVDITSAGTGVGTLAVSSTAGDHPHLPGNAPFALDRYWTINGAGISGFVADVTFAYQASDLGGANPGNFIVARHLSEQDWQEFGEGATVIDPVNHLATISNVSEFSEWTLYEEFSEVSEWIEY